MRRYLLLLMPLVVLLVALVFLPDSAAGESHRRPEVRSPLAAPVLRIENRANGWKIQSVLREIENRTPVDVRRGRCRHVPTEVCVTIREGNYSPAEQRRIGDPGFEWVGLALIGDRRRDVYLNNRYRDDVSVRHVAAHELGHVLGLAHHTRLRGVLGSGEHSRFSMAEVRAVRRAYKK